ncbi:MAG: 3-deoxy-D-manno-octulosonic acid transferase [Chlamydiia bacterium]
MVYGILFTIGWLVALPWIVFAGRRRGTSWQTIWNRCRAPTMQVAKAPRIWVHAVSVGEAVLMQTLIERIRREAPSAEWVITAGTEGGLQTAKRLYPFAQVILTPFDLPWAMTSLVRHIQPNLLLLSEGDLWYGMLHRVAARNTPIAVVSAKMSARSAGRWSYFPWLAGKVMKLMQLVCAQDEEMAARLRRAGIPSNRIQVTGNLKLALSPKIASSEELSQWRERLSLPSKDRVLLIGSTHPGEEEPLLKALQPLVEEGWRLLLVPRHPARRPELEELLCRLGYQGDDSPVTLIAQMGVLTTCMQLASVTILGGSFVPGIGGHNLWEPVQLGCPVLYGPHHQTQKNLACEVAKIQGGACVGLEDLLAAVRHWNGRSIVVPSSGQIVERTWQALHSVPAIRDALQRS